MATITCTTEAVSLATSSATVAITRSFTTTPEALSVAATPAVRTFLGPLPTRHFSFDPWGLEEFFQYGLDGDFMWAGYVPNFNVKEIRFYSGAQPASPDTDVTSQVLLGRITFLNGSLWQGQDWGYDASDNLYLNYEGATQNPVYESIADGTVTWFRVLDEAGVVLMDGSVGTEDADLIVNQTALDGSVEVRIDKFTLIYQHTERG
jgi:hypothetical protein